MPKVLKIREIPSDWGNQHPEPPNPVLPKHEFTMSLIAPKGSGKTTLIINLLKFYKKYFHTIIVFSPSIESDDKWDWLKNQDLLVENKELKSWIKELSAQQDENRVVQRAPPGKELQALANMKKPVDGRIPEECFFEEYDTDTLQQIIGEQRGVIKLLKKHGEGKRLANRVLMIFDDLVGSKLFSSRRQDPFKILNTKHRHLSTSIIMVTQAYREIPKTVRTNFTCLIAFEIANEKELEALYEEFPMGLKRSDWDEMYRYCVQEEYGFMFLNMLKKEKTLRIMKNFDQVIFYKSD